MPANLIVDFPTKGVFAFLWRTEIGKFQSLPQKEAETPADIYRGLSC